jgi:transcriptional regulator with XRE-family HTH domain
MLDAMTIRKPWLELQQIRTRDGWELTQLAEAAGVSRESLRLYELGKRSPRPKTIRKLATAMKVAYSVLAPSPRDGDTDHGLQEQDNEEEAMSA